MFLKSLLASFICLCSGIGVAAGTFAFLLVIRVIPRMVKKAKLEHKVIYIENIVFRGIIFGTILSLFSWKKKWLFELLGRTLLTFYGISAGIFTGCLAVALAEILDTFPIFFRRLKLNENYSEGLLFVMAIGKMLGSLFFFLTGYGTISP
ncbi:MAG: stage V sporulation protein AB [Agathobacter sp.]|nr:stage V sporulation protein AB [Agathobacter sp.]